MGYPRKNDTDLEAKYRRRQLVEHIRGEIFDWSWTLLNPFVAAALSLAGIAGAIWCLRKALE
jgi:hypothetical protein